MAKRKKNWHVSKFSFDGRYFMLYSVASFVFSGDAADYAEAQSKAQKTSFAVSRGTGKDEKPIGIFLSGKKFTMRQYVQRYT